MLFLADAITVQCTLLCRMKGIEINAHSLFRSCLCFSYVKFMAVDCERLTFCQIPCTGGAFQDVGFSYGLRFEHLWIPSPWMAVLRRPPGCPWKSALVLTRIQSNTSRMQPEVVVVGVCVASEKAGRLQRSMHCPRGNNYVASCGFSHPQALVSTE